jgi:hypothetical protein
MTTLHRGIIEISIKAMEPGRFQEFMLRFLPLYDSIYVGMIGHGQTEFAKTRAGVPDLLKTFGNGDQLGCECGTNEDYWFPPQDAENFVDWKPIEDALKCISRMAQPIEIILSSNKSIPGKHPNAKTLIINYLQTKTTARIKLFSCSDLALWFDSNLERKEVLMLGKEFFPEVFNSLALQRTHAQIESAFDVMGSLGIPSKEIFEIIKGAGQSDPIELKDQVLAELINHDKRFTIIFPGQFDGLKRTASISTSIKNPHGHILQLLGAPKIGKTNLCWEVIDNNSYQYKWFSTPPDERLQDDFIDMFLVSIYANFMSRTDATAKIKGWKNIQLGSYNGKESIYYVVDEAHLLQANQLKRLDRALKELKLCAHFSKVGITLISNKNLVASLSSIEETYVAPPWTLSEIAYLLKKNAVEISDPNPNEYLQLLTTQSCGHPLFALSLSKKYKNRSELLLNTMQGPSQHDVNLSAELTAVLYQDILVSSDQQNFVQRLSILNGKLESDILEAIRIDVEPQIQATAQNLTSQIGPAVLEGNIADGLKVTVTFREVAKKRISQEEGRRVYLAAGNKLLQINNNTIDSARFLDGIYYLFLSHDLERASASALLLLHCFLKSEPEDTSTYRKYLLDQLFYFKLIKLENLDQSSLLNISVLFLMLGTQHVYQEDFVSASEYFEKIDVNKLSAGSSPEVNEILKFMRPAATYCQIMTIQESPSPTTTAMGFIELVSNAAKENDDFSKEMRDAFPAMIWRLSIEKLITFDFAALADKMYPAFSAEIVDIAISVGVKARNSSELLKAISSLETHKENGPRLFGKMACASFNLETQKSNEALKLADEAIEILRNEKNADELLGPIYFQHLGDILYSLSRFQEAIDNFKLSTKLVTRKNENAIAWNHFKIGLASENSDEVIKNLTHATTAYQSMGLVTQASKAAGALSVHYLKENNIEKSLDLAGQLIKWFYSDGKKESGPSLRLILAQYLGYLKEHNSNFDQEFKDIPAMEKRYYLTVNKDLAPVHGQPVAYQLLAQVAKAAKLDILEIQLLKKAIYSNVETDLDKQTLFINWYQLFQSLKAAEFNEFEMTLMLKKLSAYQPIPLSLKEESFFFHALFKPFEDRAKADPKVWAEILLKVIEKARVISAELDESLEARWDFYLNFSEAIACSLLKLKFRSYELFRKVVKKAIEDSNWTIGEDAAISAASRLWDAHPSVKEAGKSFYEVFLCKEGKGLTQSQIQELGTNMFRFWAKVSFNKVSDDDLMTVQYLSDSAKILDDSGFSETEAAPILVHLLVKLFKHPQIDLKLFESIKQVPQEIRTLLETIQSDV